VDAQAAGKLEAIEARRLAAANHGKTMETSEF